ncbi:hypothetical protein Smp_161660 [Schistosoma mansoni]|uniref:hypothetical protein n=1 Tax=Schistosoma mansoni TaxID=6183 RepID=UPI0001A61DD0|nr:hypothetical protein Smp_161660 [Schistosoma mansoni]|eukprot:XP_018645454.1 hypothetical protein Smp_161660 [Schistosoma mansoni]
MKTTPKFSSGYECFIVDSIKNSLYMSDCLISFSAHEQAKNRSPRLHQVLEVESLHAIPTIVFSSK